jgi:hypothetical protein
LSALVLELELPVQLRVMMPPAVGASAACGQERAQRRLLLRANRVVVVEVRRQVLALIGVAQTQGQAQPVGEVDDVVREESEVFASLLIFVSDRAEITQLLSRSIAARKIGVAGPKAGIVPGTWP